jgi:Ca2+-binding RTX toxin-like protein
VGTIATELASQISGASLGPAVGEIDLTGSDFTVEFSISGAAPTGTATIGGAPVATQLNTIPWTQSQVTIPAALRVGETWSIALRELDGTLLVDADFTVSAGQNATNVANALAGDLDGHDGFDVSANAGTITITRPDAFRMRVQVVSSGSGSASAAISKVIQLNAAYGNANDAWVLTLDGVVDVTVQGTDVNALAAALALEIDNVPGYFAAAEDAKVVISRNNGVDFTTTLRVIPADTVTLPTARTARVTIPTPPFAADNFILVVDTHRFTASGSTDPADIAESLAADVDALGNYSATSTGARIDITRTGADLDSVGLAVNPVGSATTTELAASRFTLAGTANQGDTWTLSGVGADIVQPVASTTNAAGMAGLFAPVINNRAGWVAFASGAAVHITRIDGSAFTPSLAVTRDPAAPQPTISGTLALRWTQELTLAPSGPIPGESGDVWVIPIRSSDVTYIVPADVNDINLLATALASAINAAGIPGLETVTAVGSTLTIARTDGNPANVGPAKQVRATPYDADHFDDEKETDSRTRYQKAQFNIVAEKYTSGETWLAIIDGITYQVELPPQANVADRTLAKIAELLAQAINDDPRNLWYTASSTGVTVKLADRAVNPLLGHPTSGPLFSDDPFTLVARAKGEVVGVFDVDNASVIESFREVSVTRYIYLGFGINIPFTTTYNIPYRTFPTLELYRVIHTPGEADQFVLLASDWGVSATTDLGSATGYDPFIQHKFEGIDATGDFELRVGSFIDYDDNPYFADSTEPEPVTAGQHYDLIVSLQRHPTNSNAVSLIGKTLTFLDGNENVIGRSGTIVAYDPEAGEFILETPINAGDIAQWNKYEISFDPFDSAVGFGAPYAEQVPVIDWYEAILTGRPQPGQEVIVDATPVATRTYNADAAFNPDLGFGEGNEVQVKVATDRAHVVLSGVPAAHETWKLTLTPVSAEGRPGTAIPLPQPVEGRTLTQIADGLKTQLESHGYTVTLDANGTGFTITHASAFFADFEITPDTRGAWEASTTNKAGYPLISKTGAPMVSVELKGFPTQGETWTLNLARGAETHSVAVTVKFREDLASLADRLAAAVKDITGAPYVVSVFGRVISLSRADLGSFTAAVDINTESQGEGTVTAELRFTDSNWYAHQRIYVQAIDDSFIDGGDALVFPAFEERVNSIRGPLMIEGGIRVGEERFLNDPFRLPGETNFPMAEGTVDSTSTIPAGTDPQLDGKATLANENAMHVNAATGERPGFDPRMNDFAFAFTFLTDPLAGRQLDVLSVSEDILSVANDTPFTVDFTAPGDFTFFGIPNQTDLADISTAGGWTQVVLSFAGKPKVGEVWNVTLGGNPHSVTVGEGRAVLSLVAQDLAAVLKTAGYNVDYLVSLLGTPRLFIAATDGTLFTFTFGITDGPTGTTEGTVVIGGTPDQNVLGDGGIRWTQAAFLIREAAAGTWTSRIAGASYSFVASASDSIADISTGLYDEITNTGGSAYGPLVSGSTVTFKSPWFTDQHGNVASPAAGARYSIAPVNLNTRVVEEDQVDTLNVFHGNSPADDFGLLTDSRLIGLGMGGDASIAGRVIQGGITYAGLEAIEIELGTGNDHFTVESTHEGSTALWTGAGRDFVNVRSISGHTFINTGSERDTVNVGAGVLTAATGANATTPEGKALTTDRSRTVDEVTALLTIDGGGADHTGTLTAIGATTVTDFNADFPTSLPDVIDLKSLAIDVMTQTNVGQLVIERNAGGLPTGRLLFTPNAGFSDRETFSFEYRLRDVNGHRSTYVAAITAPILETDGNRLNTFVIDVTNAATRSAHLVSAVGLYIEVFNADGTVKRTGVIDANTTTVLTVAWAPTGGTPAIGDRYRVFGTPAWGDTVTVDDTADIDDSVGILTPTTLTGLDMPTVPEVQTITVQAKGGTYRLVMPGHGFGTFDYTYTAAQFGNRLTQIYNSLDIRVSEARSTTNVIYTVQFVGNLAGNDFDQIVWDKANSALIPNPNASADVLIATLRDGRVDPISEVQSITVDAASGAYKLRTNGFGTKAGFRYDPAAPYIARDETFALVTLDFTSSPAEVASRLTKLYGFPAGSIVVEETVRTSTRVSYKVTFGGEVSGRNMPPLQWAETEFTTALVPAPETPADVRMVTLKDGHTVNNAQTITVDADDGSFDLTILGKTVTVPFNATADQLRRLLNPVLNPNGSNIDDLHLESALPYTDNVAVSKYGNDYIIVFRGEYTFLKIKPENIDTTDLDGTVKLATRVSGINYYNIGTLNIGLGSGEDVFNVRGTSAVTNLDTHDGDEQIYVSSTADLVLGDYIEFLSGDLNDLKGTLNIYVGSGHHKLMISDEAVNVGDTNVLITDIESSATARDKDVAKNAEIFIVGMATSQTAGSITFRADDAANFADGITMWTGYGNDTIKIDGTHVRAGLRTITTLNTGLGDDTVTVDLQASEDEFFVLNTQGPYNDLMQLASDIKAGDHKTAADQVKVSVDGVELDSRLYSVNYAQNFVALATNTAQSLTSTLTVRITRPDGTVATESFTLATMPVYSDKDKVFGSTSSLPLIVFGGHDDDTIYGGTAGDIIFGDRGRILYFDNAAGPIPAPAGYDITMADLAALEAYSAQVLGHGGWLDKTDGRIHAISLAISIDPTVGGADTIHASTGNNIIFGGNGGDTITAITNDNIVLADNGYIDWAITDHNPADIDRIVTFSPVLGVDDRIDTGAGYDLIFGGTGSDEIHAGAGNDLVFGDHGRLDIVNYGTIDGAVLARALPLSGGYITLPFAGLTGLQDPFTFTSIDTQNTDLGAPDVIYGEDGDDILIGGQGGDLIYGGNGGDDIIGGHNVAGGHDGDDIIDGSTAGVGPTSGPDQDFIAGDNASILRRGDTINPLMRALQGTAIYRDGLALITSTHQTHPLGAEMRTIVLYDHSHTPAANTYGADYIAGGPDNDHIFGQLGDDVIQGDGAIQSFVDTNPNTLPVSARRVPNGLIALTPTLSVPSIGKLLFTASFEATTDGDDYIEGNGGHDVIFGNLGQDDIIGGSSSLFSLITPDLRPDGEDIIFGGAGTRAGINADLAQGDLIYAERHARDSDTIVGDNNNIYRLVGTNGANAGRFLEFEYDKDSSRGTRRIVPRAVEYLDYTPGGPSFDTAANTDIGGPDEVHGESGDDFIYGLKGNDALFGDSQDDDVIGGWGDDWISGGTGQDGVLGDDGRIYTSRNSAAFGESLYGIAAIPSAQLDLLISTPGNMQQAVINVNGALKKTVDLTPFNLTPKDQPDDPLYDPGFADDLIFGGLGSDFLHGGAGDDAISGAEALSQFFVQPANPGNILRFNDVINEFADYDEDQPMVRINPFLLNFDIMNGPAVSNVHTDGDDVIFGDLGNDWIVGGTGKDTMFGGWGDDLMNADDDHSTNTGLNNRSDTNVTYEDRAYGGAGVDVLIGNTGGDRLIDWTGEFNSFLVPFSPFGMATVSRALQPQVPEFLYQLSASYGADPTRAADDNADPTRKGEPFGELGLVLQQDAAWQEQTGPPGDPQPGNTSGTKRDVLRSAAFDGPQPTSFVAESGAWKTTNGTYETSPIAAADQVSLLMLGDQLPNYSEIVTTVNANKAKTGVKSNGYIIFDYQSATDFKYAGVDVALRKVQIGHRTATGWRDLAEATVSVDAMIDYELKLIVDRSNATVLLNGTVQQTYNFGTSVTSGLVGLGASNSVTRFDNVAVLVLPPPVPLSVQDNFKNGLSAPAATQSGHWQVSGGKYQGTPTALGAPAISTWNVAVDRTVGLRLQVTVNTMGYGGLIFDYQNEYNFKFAGVLSATGQFVIGHRDANGWAFDAVLNSGLASGIDYRLSLSLRESSASLYLNGQSVLTATFGATLTDGYLGLFSLKGTTVFDDLSINTFAL